MAGKVRVGSYAVSADGFGAGPDQSLSAPLGVGGETLHEWFFPTDTFQKMYGKGQGETGVDEGFARRGMDGIGAWILGRNMFAHSRGPWPEDGWKGWWGEEPPYRVPVFILTHHPRASFEMKGGTVFHFETGGIEAALERARAAAGDRDIRIGGGAETIRQYLQAGLIDEMHIAVSPILLGRGEPLWAGLDLPALGYAVLESTAGERATHLRIGRRDGSRKD
ncbi:dihydrofolate reductase family protein [Roseibacterium beibuensis]|uniref:dihydrofolate reductase family protein n=1 Tax=[Roseibacterium] beibuensis TaxID=1193142 RepID=UPI00217EC975|nr:dihydrofolate reductase family protein [Roseibacterium beibuensis]MCS6627458.1 dihydrofolate reductase family protein [Roseibacterium beibuensis]